MIQRNPFSTSGLDGQIALLSPSMSVFLTLSEAKKMLGQGVGVKSHAHHPDTRRNVGTMVPAAPSLFSSCVWLASVDRTRLCCSEDNVLVSFVIVCLPQPSAWFLSIFLL